jgi:threonine/homoserine/homoserine lactone efflux protein
VDAFSLDLLAAAAAIALTHTVLGPDHTLPFVMLARARHWSRRRTLVVTFLCGIGHVGSSVLLGTVGLALGYGVAHITAAETARGDLAAWALVAVGTAYAAWGIRHAIRSRAGIVAHEHHGHLHVHTHGDAAHDHPAPDRSRTTFWALFTVFVLGPCEPLIPLFVLPASRGRWGAAAATAVVFSIVTIATMVTLVSLAVAGVRRLPFESLERWSHALAGGVIAGSGLAVIFLGL